MARLGDVFGPEDQAGSEEARIRLIDGFADAGGAGFERERRAMSSETQIRDNAKGKGAEWPGRTPG